MWDPTRPLIRVAILTVVAACLVMGCGDDPSGGTTAPDTGGDDVPTIDAIDDTPDARGDAAEGDADEDCIGLGCPCEDDAECASGYCIRDGSGDARICSELCDGECSRPGFVCRLLENAEGDAVRLCVPESDPYCRACEVDAECGSLANACVDQRDGAFCATACDDETRCPSGAECATVSVGGEMLDLCVPVDGRCEGCVDADGDGYGVGPECAGADCDDTRRDVYDGAPEVCDDVDNDCDGGIDEDFDLTRDIDHCGACSVACTNDHGDTACVDGVCTPTCADGYADCNEDPTDGCERELDDDGYCTVCGDEDRVAGTPCGTCDTGVWDCTDTGLPFCDGDLGPDALNVCGTCGDLDAAPGDPCGACGDGTLACGDDGLVCEGAGDTNACGGCAPLDGDLGGACGECGTGVWACDGDDALFCRGADPANACGGCEPLDSDPGDPCGRCGDGALVCDGVDALACEGDDPDAPLSCLTLGTIRFGWSAGTSTNDTHMRVGVPTGDHLWRMTNDTRVLQPMPTPSAP